MKVSHIALLFGLIGLSGALPTFANTASICDGVSGNLVGNCGFEMDNFTDWTVTDASAGSALDVSTVAPDSGTYNARFGASSSQNDYIDQLITTSSSSSYNISFYINSSLVGSSGQFVANWGTTNLLTITGSTNSNGNCTAATTANYEVCTFTENGGPGVTTDLDFGGNNKLNSYHLDDVSVVKNTSAVPEPSSVSFAVAGLFGILVVGRRYMQKRSNS